MKNLLFKVLFICIIALLFSSCVSSKKYKSLQSEKDKLAMSYEKQLSDLKSDYTAKESGFNDKISKMSKDLDAAKSDVVKFKNMSEERSKVLAKLEQDLKEAFAGIENPDLKIIQKYEKMYISLPNRILYKKGDDVISDSGKNVLDMLSTIFKKNPSMDILIEGHTDNDPVIKTKEKYIDNWGLSSSRSLNALRYLISKGVNEKQLSASGRADQDTTGEIMEGKDRNAYDRRIEFVVTPDVHKLYSIKETIK